MPVLDDLKAFNITDATASLWVFKGPRGASNMPPQYTARWVDTNNDVDAVLKDVVRTERDRIEEEEPYDLLAQVNEASGLSITKEETYAHRLTDATAAETPNKQADKLQKLQNTAFYLIKLIHGEQVLYAVRRASSIWKTKRSLSSRFLVLAGDTLALDDGPRFDIESKIDFFVLGPDILILHKGHFESILRYKAAHAEDFAALLQEPGFANLFVDVAPLVQHVGTNKIQLRRMCAVRQKAHYRDNDFMDRVRAHHADYGLTIEFDNAGKIIATTETGAQVIMALLDHRLASGFSKRIYDVPSATPVNI